MLTKLYEEILKNLRVTPVNASQILPTDDVIVQFANNDPLRSHRIQIIEVDDPTDAPDLVPAENQNPAAFEDIAPSTDGTMSCVAPAPKFNISCADATQSAYFYVYEADRFDIDINGVTYVNKTFAEITALLAEKQVELAPMIEGEYIDPDLPPPLRPMIVSGPTEPDVYIRSATQLSINWGDYAVGDENAVYDQAANMYTYHGVCNSDFLGEVKIEITHQDHESKLNNIHLENLSVVEQWYEGGYHGFTGNTYRGIGAVIERVPNEVPNCSDLTEMFYGATLFNGDISAWDTSKVSLMVAMFQGATLFNQPIGSWNMSRVYNVANMFYGASAFDQDLSNWNTTRFSNMENMFQEATSFNKPVGSWDVSNVTSLSNVFRDALAFNQPVGLWATRNVTNMEYTFAGSGYNQPLANWNTEKVVTMEGMFQDNAVFDQSIITWNVSRVTNFSYMFNNAVSFNQDLEVWNTASVTNMCAMFSGAVLFNGDLSLWDVSKVTDMSYVFSRATAFNQPLNTWNTISVVNMAHMFENATSFNQYLGDWNVSNVTNMGVMFHLATNYNHDLFNWCVENILEEPVEFYSGSDLEAYQLPIWGTCPSPNMSLSLPPMEPKIVDDQATIEFTSPIAVRTVKWTLSDPTLADFDESILQLTFKNAGILTVTVVVNDLLTASFDVQIKPRIVVRAPYNLQLEVSPVDSDSNI